MEVIHRNTKQRKRILEKLKTTIAHPTAEWVYGQLKDEMPSLSLGTVYRNLKILKDRGEIVSLRTSDSSEHFDGNTDLHHHFVCRKCNKIFDLNILKNSGLLEKMESVADGRVESYELQLKGVCNKCLKR